jgi:hypothetical protein
MLLLEAYVRQILLEGVSESAITKAIKTRERQVINYISSVPGYEIADGLRYIDIYALGVGRFEDELCIRAYQPFGDTASSVPGWKIFYLKDITFMRGISVINKEVAPNFNQSGDRWMKSVILMADYKKFGSKGRDDVPPPEPELYKTDTEKDIERRRQQKPSKIDITNYSKTTRERFKEVKSVANKALSLYNKAKRLGNQIEADKALKVFRDAQSYANKLMSAYKQELQKMQDG